MKKLIIGAMLLTFLGGETIGWCGMDFSRSSSENVPRTFCWSRQDQGDMTFGGQLNLACSGTECGKSNYILNTL